MISREKHEEQQNTRHAPIRYIVTLLIEKSHSKFPSRRRKRLFPVMLKLPRNWVISIGNIVLLEKMFRKYMRLKFFLPVIRMSQLRDLVQFKKREKHPRRSVTVSKGAAFSMQLY